MVKENDPLLVYTTFDNMEDAKKVGCALVEARLAACVNIIPRMTAIYEWKGVLTEAAEAVMLIKTRKGLMLDVLRRTRKLHPYETPALLAIDPVEVDADFAAWIAARTDPGGSGR